MAAYIADRLGAAVAAAAAFIREVVPARDCASLAALKGDGRLYCRRSNA